MQVQNYLRHCMSETISEGIINCLIVTNSSEANVQLTRIHEHIFARMWYFLTIILPLILISLFTSTSFPRRSNCCKRMEEADILRRRRFMYPRHDVQHSLRTYA